MNADLRSFPPSGFARGPRAIGRGGDRTLLSRALALSRTEVDWLRSVLVTDTGALEIPSDISELLKRVKQLLTAAAPAARPNA